MWWPLLLIWAIAPHIEDLVGTIKVVLDRFDAGEVDEVHLASNEFVNTMTQSPTIKQLVPFAIR